MKYMAAIAVFLAANLSFASEETGVIRLSEPVEQTVNSETFGSVLDETVPEVGLQQLVSDSSRYEGSPVRVAVRVSQVCQKKGCFFIAQDGDAFMRVSFKDYGFFVPTDISGRRVTLVGEIVGREMTPEEAAHYNEDLGEKSVAIEAGMIYEIVATSVRVPKAG